ncbi:hypothetical protein EDD16DRAFT_1617686, partial [Pisolithus croceorrhizus]
MYRSHPASWLASLEFLTLILVSPFLVCLLFGFWSLRLARHVRRRQVLLRLLNGAIQFPRGARMHCKPGPCGPRVGCMMTGV